MTPVPGTFRQRHSGDEGFVYGFAGMVPTPNPAPRITTISPTSAAAGAVAFTLTVNGSGFISTSVVNWNGSPRTTTFVSATKLQAAIRRTDLATAGAFSVVVVSPAPGGGTSNAATFTVT